MDRKIERCTSKGIDRRRNGQTDRQIDGWTSGQIEINRYTYILTFRRRGTDQLMVRWMGRQPDSQTARQPDSQTARQPDSQTDGQTD